MAKKPRKPPKGQMCDAHVDVDYSGHSPHLVRCPNLATLVVKTKPFPWDQYLCDSCYAGMKERPLYKDKMVLQ